MIRFKRIPDTTKQYGIFMNGDKVAKILLNKQNAIVMFKDIKTAIDIYDDERYAVEIVNVQDGIKVCVWSAEGIDPIYENNFWFVDYDVVR